ncbi:MAG: hypothetical protein LBQ86_05600 [Holophagales bacterium]|jgi:cytochrome c553|nr:hypothetical protein [Holophagales bacterium]
MKKTTTLLLGVAVAAIPAFASQKMVKQCKDLGITEIKNCASCHTSKSPKEMSEKDLNEIGKWLLEQKAAKNAKECDVAWLKEYFANKK